MATIVQPYTPWREQLLANLLGPLVGNMIQNSQQNAQNKKYNAMLGELAKAGQAQQAPQVTPSLFTGMQQQEPSNGWERAFYQGGNELANFDANTASVPTVTPSPVNQYNQADMMRNYMQIMANPRFASLNPETAYKLATPFLQSLQAQRMTDLRSQYAKDFMNAGSFDDQMRYLAGGGIEGAVTPELISSYRPYAEHRQPHMTFAEMDAGDQKYRLAQNPATGQVTPMFSANVGVSPNTLATTAAQRYIADQTAGLEQQRITNTQINADRDYGLNERKVAELETQGQYNREHPNNELYITQDQAGNIIGIDKKTGQLVPVTRDGQAVKGQPKNAAQDLTRREQETISYKRSQLEALQKEKNAIYDKMNDPDKFGPEDHDTPEYINLVNRGEVVLNQIDSLKEEIEGLLKGSQPQSTPSVTPKPPESASTQGNANSRPIVTPSPISGDIEPSAPAPTEQPAPGQGSGRWVREANENPRWIPNAQQTPLVTPSPVTQDIGVPVNNTVSVEPESTGPRVTPQPQPAIQAPTAPENSVARTGALSTQPVDDISYQYQTGKDTFNFSIKDLSPEAYYDPVRDKNIPQDNILTPKQFGALVVEAINRNPIYSQSVNPNVIANTLIRHGGIRIRRGK